MANQIISINDFVTGNWIHKSVGNKQINSPLTNHRSSIMAVKNVTVEIDLDDIEITFKGMLKEPNLGPYQDNEFDVRVSFYKGEPNVEYTNFEFCSDPDDLDGMDYDKLCQAIEDQIVNKARELYKKLVS